MRGSRYVTCVISLFVLGLIGTMAYPAPVVAPTSTPDSGVVCLGDQDRDGVIRVTSPWEVFFAPSAEACVRMRGAVAEKIPQTEIEQFNRTLEALDATTVEELTLYLATLQHHNAPRVNPTPSPSPIAYAATPAARNTPSENEARRTLSIHGPVPNVPAGGLLPSQTLKAIQRIIAPRLKGRVFKDNDDPATSFNCQDYAEWADNAYPALTYTTISCHLICKRAFYIPGVQWPWKSKDAFGHTFNDLHLNGMIYFIEPQSHWLPQLAQLDLDLNRDGVISAVEVGPARDFDPALLDDFSKGCAGDAIVLCNIMSFEDRQLAYGFYSSNGLNGMDPAKLNQPKSNGAKPLKISASRY